MKGYFRFSRNDRSPSHLFFFFPDDADAGEIKKSHKSVRRRQREAANNQKQEEASKRQWEAHRSSVSSHSSGDEVQLCRFLVIRSKILVFFGGGFFVVFFCHFNMRLPHTLQGEESVVTGLAPPPAMLESPPPQATPMNFNDNTEGEADPKTGNTCNALSGRTESNLNTNPDIISD